MKNSRTLTLKIAISILTVVFFAVCITSGIVFASITSKISTNVPGVPTARLFSELWTTADTGGQITSGSIPKSSPLYVSATQSNGKEAVEPYCVMRAVATDNVTFDTSNWILQDNGWYYCTQVVGGGSQTRVALGQTTAEFNNANDKIVVELMQFSSDSNGFAKFWSPLAGRDTTTISQNSTVDGHSFTIGTGAVSDIFVPFNPKYTQFMSITDTVSTADIEDVLLAPIPAGTYSSSTPVNLTINSLNKSTANDNLLIYNNSVVPMILTISYAPSIWVRTTTDSNTYQSSSELQGFSVELSNADSNFELVSDEGAVYRYIYKQIIMPGEYVNALSENITFTYNSNNVAISGDYAVRVAATISLEDVDTFDEHIQRNDTTYSIFASVFNENVAMQSKYWNWLEALTPNAQAVGLTMPVYTKLNTTESNEISTMGI